MEVKRISAEDTYHIRQRMLRPDGTEADCHFKGDKDELTFHLGAFEDKKLISIASFYFENNKNFEKDHPYQFRLRGMATLEGFGGKGCGSALLKTAIPLIKQNQCDFLWCNARVSAQGFYEKVGFKAIGEEFIIDELPDIPHVLMGIFIDTE